VGILYTYCCGLQSVDTCAAIRHRIGTCYNAEIHQSTFSGSLIVSKNCRAAAIIAFIPHIISIALMSTLCNKIILHTDAMHGKHIAIGLNTQCSIFAPNHPNIMPSKKQICIPVHINDISISCCIRVCVWLFRFQQHRTSM